MTDDSPLHVACSADARYLPHSAAMLHSVLACSDARPVHVHYLHGRDIAQADLARLERMVTGQGGSFSSMELPPEMIAGLPTWEYVTAPMWYRIFLPDLVPDADRILYLDVDTIAIGSLEELWQTDLTDYYLAAVSNVFQLNHLSRLAALDIDMPQSYFNSGVLLMNLDLMRRDGCSHTLREHAIENAQQLLWPDQDTLNLVLGQRRLPLHPRWNYMNSIVEFPWSVYVFGAKAVREAARDPGIRHFEGPSVNKPWHYLCETQLRDAYSAHRLQTPWPELRLEGVTPRNRLVFLNRTVRRRARRLLRR
jgi:lipopolysaccharide biosynthesis glycosyltransferase